MKVSDIMEKSIDSIDLCVQKNGYVECFYHLSFCANIAEYDKVLNAYGDLDVDYIRVNQDVLDVIIK